MFAVSITAKLLTWYLALRYGDAGPDQRPWALGGVIGVVFAFFDIVQEARELWVQALIFVVYLATGCAVMHVYYRVRSIWISILICAVGTALLFMAIPWALVPALTGI